MADAKAAVPAEDAQLLRLVVRTALLVVVGGGGLAAGAAAPHGGLCSGGGAARSRSGGGRGQLQGVQLLGDLLHPAAVDQLVQVQRGPAVRALRPLLREPALKPKTPTYIACPKTS